MAASTAASSLRVRQIDQFEAELLGENGQEDLLLDEALVDENLMRRELGRCLDRFGGADAVGLGKQAAAW